jgi:Zn-dependent protease with chaperone function
MIAALILLGYAGLLAVLGPRVLLRGRWTDRSPKLGIITWQALTATVLVSVAMAGFALAVPTVRVSADLADLFRACIMTLRSQYAAPGGALAAALGATAALAVLGRAWWCVASSLGGALRSRRHHRNTVDLLGRPEPALGAVVIEHAEPVLYCLPGARRRIVISSGALRVLDDEQLAAALAHERAHLTQRHDLVLALSGGLARAFPRVHVFTRAHSETLRLVELLADDVAARTSPRLVLAEALLNLGGGTAPAPALAAGGSTAAARVHRLIGPYRPLSRVRAMLTSTAVAVALALPVIGLAAPAVATGHLHYCPPGSVAESTQT